MNETLDSMGNKIGLSDIIYILSQGFGEDAAYAFVQDRQRNGHLDDVKWGECDACDANDIVGNDIGYSPIFEGACLICGDSVNK